MYLSWFPNFKDGNPIYYNQGVSTYLWAVLPSQALNNCSSVILKTSFVSSSPSNSDSLTFSTLLPPLVNTSVRTKCSEYCSPLFPSFLLFCFNFHVLSVISKSSFVLIFFVLPFLSSTWKISDYCYLNICGDGWQTKWAKDSGHHGRVKIYLK